MKQLVRRSDDKRNFPQLVNPVLVATYGNARTAAPDCVTIVSLRAREKSRAIRAAHRRTERSIGTFGTTRSARCRRACQQLLLGPPSQQRHCKVARPAKSHTRPLARLSPAPGYLPPLRRAPLAPESPVSRDASDQGVGAAGGHRAGRHTATLVPRGAWRVLHAMHAVELPRVLHLPALGLQGSALGGR